MIYGYIAIALAIFSAGTWTGYRFESANTQRLQLAIERANVEAEQQLNAAKQRAVESEIRETARAAELEKANAQNVVTANALLDRVHAVRRANCANPVPKTDSAGASETKAADDSEFERLCFSAATYATSCWRYVNEN